MSQQPQPRHAPWLVQAPVRAVDQDGVTVFTIGTALFALATLVCWWQLPSLAAVGRDWYVWTALSGTILGLLGTAYCVRRKSRRSQDARAPEVTGTRAS